VLGLGTVFRLAGLGAAANVVQILSVLPLLAAVIKWAQDKRKSAEPNSGALVRRDELLRTIADASGLTGEEVRSHLQDWNGETVDAYLDGLKRPSWDFVAAFLKVVADDPWHRDVLERRIRAAWQAPAASQRVPATAERMAGQEIRQTVSMTGSPFCRTLPITGDWLTERSHSYAGMRSSRLAWLKYSTV
jgi:hypothetical protein